MQALKFLVIAMGVLIFAGLAVVIVTLGNRMSGGDRAPENGAAPFSAHDFNTHDIALPAGAELRDATLADGRLVVRLAMPDGVTRLLLFDAEDGRPVGRFDLRPAP